uniref:Putative LOV domain-containing protein n=1 Tax=Ishige okamurae TaxID=233772 RepID=A0A126WV07_9PHAE|nr:putative LOV domain-containing protein [Ishige okamurae]
MDPSGDPGDGSSLGPNTEGPSPPVFGNANGQTTSGDMMFKGMNLDDIFSGVFFSPEGDLLTLPSDEEDALFNLTLSSSGGGEGAGSVAKMDGSAEDGDMGQQPQFAQYAVLGSAVSQSEAKPEERKSPQGADVAGTGDKSADTQKESGGQEGTKGTSEGTGEGGPMLVPLSSAVSSEQPATSGGREAPAEAKRAAKVAAAEAERAAEEALAAQETARSKAAAAMQAAAAHQQAEAQARMQLRGRVSGQRDPPASVASGAVSATGQGIGIGRGLQLGQVPSPGVSGSGLGRVAPTRVSGAKWEGSSYAGRTTATGAGAGAGAVTVNQPVRRQRHKVSSKDLTEEQRIERRERNREHAKRSRVRKKFLLDSLQRSVDALQVENDSLKGSIVESLGDRGRELVAKCVPEEAEGLITANPKQATKILDDPDYSLVKALQTAQQNFVITDASLPDNPIVFASSGFLELTGYKLNEVLGRNCRFLQGPATDPKAVDKIRKAIEDKSDTSVCLLNYRADGTTFWNQFFVASLRDGDGNTVNYVGVQCKVGDDYARIVVGEQNRQLSTPAPASRRGAPMRGTKQTTGLTSAPRAGVETSES